MTITIKLAGEETQREILDAARDAFPDATSICVESEDGTSETILVRHK